MFVQPKQHTQSSKAPDYIPFVQLHSLWTQNTQTEPLLLFSSSLRLILPQCCSGPSLDTAGTVFLWKSRIFSCHVVPQPKRGKQQVPHGHWDHTVSSLIRTLPKQISGCWAGAAVQGIFYVFLVNLYPFLILSLNYIKAREAAFLELRQCICQMSKASSIVFMYFCLTP